MADELIIKDLHVSVEDKEILHGINLTIQQGQVNVIMGPNGSGKSTLSNVVMGHPRYTVTSGDIIFKGESILELSADRRAKRGLFLAFQYPYEVPGVSAQNFLRTALTNIRKGDVVSKVKPGNLDVVGDGSGGRKASLGGDGANIDRSKKESLIPPKEFREIMRKKLQLLHMEEKFVKRYLNDGFSGGEKKRMEILQMAVLEPKIAFLDEPDSGLDIDAIRIVGEGVSSLKSPDMGIVVITHQLRILNYLEVDHVSVMMQGLIVKSGGRELAKQIEDNGYGWIREEAGLAVGAEEDK